MEVKFPRAGLLTNSIGVITVYMETLLCLCDDLSEQLSTFVDVIMQLHWSSMISLPEKSLLVPRTGALKTVGLSTVDVESRRCHFFELITIR